MAVCRCLSQATVSRQHGDGARTGLVHAWANRSSLPSPYQQTVLEYRGPRVEQYGPW
jgi:hypothetical protein